MIKKAVSDLVSFVVVFIILVILAVFSNIVAVGGFGALETDIEVDYAVEGVTRFQGCDITLINLLQTQVPNRAYTFEEAIALSEISAITNTDHVQAANNIVEEIYNGVSIGWGSCIDIKKTTTQFCSQKISGFDGGCIDVRIVKN